MDALQRIKEVLSYSGLSVRAFANKCNVSQSAMDKQLKGLRGLSLETVMGILNAFEDISAEWLMRGEGAMLVSQQVTSDEKDRIQTLFDTIVTLQGNINQQNDKIASLMERNKQLESQLNIK